MSIALIHGLGSDGAHMLELFGPVLRRDERVVAVDVRAHGRSTLVGGPADFALDTLAAEVEAAMAASDVAASDAAPAVAEAAGSAVKGADQGTDRGWTIIGESMGAAIALRIALGGRVDIERMLLLRPSFTDAALPPNLQPFPVIGQLLHDLGPVEGAERFRESSLYHSSRQASPLGAAGLLAQFHHPLARTRAIRLVEVPRNRAFDDEGQLAGIDIRSMVIGAPRDPVHPFEIAQQWAGAIGCPIVRLPARDDGMPAQIEALRISSAEWLSR